jgi:hypothetical protein
MGNRKAIRPAIFTPVEVPLCKAYAKGRERNVDKTQVASTTFMLTMKALRKLKSSHKSRYHIKVRPLGSNEVHPYAAKRAYQQENQRHEKIEKVYTCYYTWSQSVAAENK